MTYQNNLFGIEVMQDRTGRIRKADKPPSTYESCEGKRHLRMLPPEDPKAERCQAFNCEFNLIGQIGQMKEGKAVEAIRRRYDEGRPETCLLDVIHQNDCNGRLHWEHQDADDISILLGIPRELVAAQIAAVTHAARTVWNPGYTRDWNFPRGIKNPWDNDKSKKAKSLRDDGKTLREIAEIMCCSTRTLQDILGLDTEHPETPEQ